MVDRSGKGRGGGRGWGDGQGRGATGWRSGWRSSCLQGRWSEDRKETKVSFWLNASSTKKKETMLTDINVTDWFVVYCFEASSLIFWPLPCCFLGTRSDELKSYLGERVEQEKILIAMPPCCLDLTENLLVPCRPTTYPDLLSIFL